MLQLKKCCCCLPPKWGCYIISAIYFFFGSLLLFRELLNAFFSFHFLRQDGGIGVIFVNDLSVTSLFLFSIFLFYGTYKENPYFVFSGVSITISLLGINCFSLILFFVNVLVLSYNPPNSEQLYEQLIASAFMAYFAVVIWSHHKEMLSKNNKGIAFRNLQGSNRDGFNQLEETN